MNRLRGVVAGLAVVLVPAVSAALTPFHLEIPAGLDAPPIPANNALTREKIALGEALFFEKALSLDRSIACASCHDPRLGFADGRATSVGIEGRTGTRNAPSVLNVAYVRELFLDGRAGSLEEQALGPILNKDEMSLPDVAAIESRLAAEARYAPLFEAAFGDPKPTAARAVQALASFERTLVALSSPWDRYVAGDKSALSDEAARGWTVFRRRAGCASCHYVIANLPVFSEMTFRSIGAGFTADSFAEASALADRIEKGEASKTDAAASKLGRYLVTGERKDIGRFRTPGLRNVAKTAPYMHDGSLATLRDVVDFYDKGGEPIPTKHPQIRRLGLSEKEKSDLTAFMEQGLVTDPSPNFDQRALEKRADEVLGKLAPR